LMVIIAPAFIQQDKFKMVNTGWRIGVNVCGELFAVDFGKINWDGGQYANVRPSKNGRIWQPNGKEEWIHHSLNVSAFYVERDGTCRAVKASKEKTATGEDKDLKNWKFWAELVEAESELIQ